VSFRIVLVDEIEEPFQPGWGRVVGEGHFGLNAGVFGLRRAATQYRCILGEWRQADEIAAGC